MFLMPGMPRPSTAPPKSFRVSVPAPPSSWSAGPNVGVAPLPPMNVLLPLSPTKLSIPVVSEPVKQGQQPSVFKGLRPFLDHPFPLTQRSPNCKKYALAPIAIRGFFAQINRHNDPHRPPNPTSQPRPGQVDGGIFPGRSFGILTSFYRLR